MAQSLPNARHIVLKPFAGNFATEQIHLIVIAFVYLEHKQILSSKFESNMHVSYLCLDFPSRIAKVQNEMRAVSSVRACLHGGGGPQVGEVTRLGGVTRLSTQALTLM